MQLREKVPVAEILGLVGPLLPPGSAPRAFAALPAFIDALEPPEAAGPGSLTFVGARSSLRLRTTLRAGLALIEPGLDGLPASQQFLPVRSIHEAIAILLDAFSDRFLRTVPFAAGAGNRVAPTAVVEGVLEGDVTVGAGAYVGRDAYIGAGAQIGPNATVLENVRIGRDCVVQSGAVIGCAGFGFFEIRPATVGVSPATKKVSAMPHPAGVVIGEGCFIGANSVIAAGVLRPTELGRGCKLDSHVQIAHNVRLGEGALLASQSGIAGSTVVGRGFRMGGAASLDGHLRIGDNVSVAACSGVTKDLSDGAVVAGFPARPIREWRREQAMLRRLRDSDPDGTEEISPGNDIA
jgi:UDP-3-O-[3-hydroxymyristoyl] glucosamine N-acyltransferase